MGATEQTQEGFRARRMGGTSLAGTKTSFSPGAEGEAVCEEDPEAAPPVPASGRHYMWHQEC